MKIKDVMLFSYDFPHKKTQDFLFKLLVENYNIKYVIAAPWEKLKIEPSSIRIAPNHVGIIHPSEICKRFGITYKVFVHNSIETLTYIENHPVDLYIISGARILSKNIIRAANNKILNIHPALLPQVRGMDLLLWSIYYNFPIGITAHFINEKIDNGYFIYKEKLILKYADTPIDISLKLLEKQPEILIKALQILKKNSFNYFSNFKFSERPYNKKMSKAYEKKALIKFKTWLTKYACIV